MSANLDLVGSITSWSGSQDIYHGFESRTAPLPRGAEAVAELVT
jgi:hypothetical protein